MLIKKIKIKNYKTYLDLELDLSVEEDKPIILIGGANGGGKTTLFDAINGALYGLQINTEEQLNKYFNAGAFHNEEKKIVLEINFIGKVLNEEKQYVLTRTYTLGASGKPVENVRLNMDGNTFVYDTSTNNNHRIDQENIIKKIIKANLPQELSRYFLFDAMEAGNLLKEDQLNRVIRENIENVMGFNKYLQMSKVSERLFQEYTAKRLKIEQERKDYLRLVEQKNVLEDQLHEFNVKLQEALQYSIQHKDLYYNLKAGLNQEHTIKSKIEQTEKLVQNIVQREANFYNDMNEFVKDIELQVFLPKVIESLRSEAQLILQTIKDEEKNKHMIAPDKINKVIENVIEYLENNGVIQQGILIEPINKYIISKFTQTSSSNQYSYLDATDIKVLEDLLYRRASNVYPSLEQQLIPLTDELGQIATFEAQIAQMKQQIAGKNYTLLEQFEQNENLIKQLENDIDETKIQINKLEKQIHLFDVQTNQEPDPKYEALGKLKGFFEDVANKLLKTKKQQIEQKMKQDLNINLSAYRDVIERVELSENLKDLTFKIYHKAGNEIYLNQLNTASKQVVVQVLLKALHELGDYDPPVMIDTVMGVLDETSRSIVLENYFPDLSQQTILLSSDSEIRIDKDIQKIKPYISRTYTLQRNKEEQRTNVVSGYFGVQ